MRKDKKEEGGYVLYSGVYIYTFTASFVEILIPTAACGVGLMQWQH